MADLYAFLSVKLVSWNFHRDTCILQMDISQDTLQSNAVPSLVPSLLFPACSFCPGMLFFSARTNFFIFQYIFLPERICPPPSHRQPSFFHIFKHL